MHFWRAQAIRVQEHYNNGYWKNVINERDNFNEQRKLIMVTLCFYGNNDITALGVWTSAFPAVLLFWRLYAASWCPNHAPDVETGESRGLRVSRRLYAA